MLKGHAKPNRVTWLMWTVAPLIAFAAAVSNGTGLAAVPVFMAGFSPLLILTSSFALKQAYWKLSRLDYACGILSAMAIVFWAGTKNPNIAIVFSILSDALASVPTLIKGWHYPETESSWPYLIGVFSAFTSFLAITAWTFSQYAFPAYLIVMNLLLVLSINGKRFFVDFCGYLARKNN
jgi:hypothetical protein